MRVHPNVQAPRSAAALSFWNLCILAGAILCSCWVATQWVAQALAFQPQLGESWFHLSTYPVYRPLDYWRWQWWYTAYAPKVFTIGFAICAVGILAGIFSMPLIAAWRGRKARIATSHGTARFATETEFQRARLLEGEGVVLGQMPDGRIVADKSEKHVACIAPTRSGKGVGQVIPTLLTWKGSVLVHDMKGENFELTSGHRSAFSNVIYFNPTDPACSAHWNPLLEVRADENQVRDVQNIADQIVDPHGKGKESHWDRTADQFFLGTILHVLHAEADKSLYGVSKFLTTPNRTFRQTLQRMQNTRHGCEMAHERIVCGAQAMLIKSEEERSGIVSTALGFLSLYADPIIARNTADSDFRITDLVQGKHPMSLYIVVPDSDRLRLTPFTRLMITMFVQRLNEQHIASLRKHRLLMLLDEFPRLGKLPFMAGAITHLAHYGIKVMLMMQSLGQLDAPEAYGRGNTIVESCDARCFYTPQDLHTAQMISDALGPKTEVHQQNTYSGHRLAPWLGHVMVSDQPSARPLMDPAEVCKLPASDFILFLAGFPPFLVKRLKYYEHPILAQRASIPPPKLRAERPYPYRPRPQENPWVQCILEPEDASPIPPPVLKGPEGQGGSPAPAHALPAKDLPLQDPEDQHGIQPELPLPEADGNSLQLRLALDEQEQQEEERKHTLGRRRNIPL